MEHKALQLSRGLQSTHY